MALVSCPPLLQLLPPQCRAPFSGSQELGLPVLGTAAGSCHLPHVEFLQQSLGSRRCHFPTPPLPAGQPPHPPALSSAPTHHRFIPLTQKLPKHFSSSRPLQEPPARSGSPCGQLPQLPGPKPQLSPSRGSHPHLVPKGPDLTSFQCSRGEERQLQQGPPIPPPPNPQPPTPQPFSHSTSPSFPRGPSWAPSPAVSRVLCDLSALSTLDGLSHQASAALTSACGPGTLPDTGPPSPGSCVWLSVSLLPPYPPELGWLSLAYPPPVHAGATGGSVPVHAWVAHMSLWT